MDEGKGSRIESLEESQKVLEDPMLIHFLCMVRPVVHGVVETMAQVEHTHYPPNTPRNDLFMVRMLTWHETIWCLVSIPKEDEEWIHESAEQFSLKACNCTALGLEEDGVDAFPIQGENVFFLLPNERNLMHRNDPDINKAYRESFKETIAHIVKSSKASKPLN